MSKTAKVALIIVVLLIYVVSPVDLFPGFIDDAIVVITGTRKIIQLIDQKPKAIAGR